MGLIAVEEVVFISHLLLLTFIANWGMQLNTFPIIFCTDTFFLELSSLFKIWKNQWVTQTAEQERT